MSYSRACEFRRVLVAAVCGIVLGFASPVLYAQEGAAKASVRVLFLVRNRQLDRQYVQELEASGFAVQQRGLTDPLSPDDLKAFNVVVIPSFLRLDSAFQVGAIDVPTWWEQNLPNLRSYVESGGGLLVATLFSEAGEGVAAALERMLRPWGARFRAVQIIDAGHIAHIEGTGSRVEDKTFYCWTERIARHPATDGVRRIYYPVCNMRWDDCYTTPPIVLESDQWHPLVRAEAGSYDSKTDKSYRWQEPMGNDDVIAAVRSVGKGRVALMSVCSYYTFFRPYTTEEKLGENHHGRIDGIPLQKGDGKVASDLGRLIANLFRWLAEPGLKEGLGGQRPLPGPVPQKAPEVQQVLDWDTLVMPPTWRHRPIPAWIDGRPYYDEKADPTIKGPIRYLKALIGVHSSYSDGKGNVAEFAEAARRGGYCIVAFTERFEVLGGRERWEQLRADCLRNSTEDLVLLPGIDIADPEGGRYLIFGQPNYPAKTWLSPDGKYLTANNAMSLGFTTHMAVIARPQTTPHQYRLYKHYQGIAVATYRGGKLVDDGYEAYVWEVANASNPIPIAVHEVYSPDEVAWAAKTGFQEIVPSDTVQHAADYFRCAMSHFFDCPARYFVSEGPIIDTWTIFNKDIGKMQENRNRYRIALGARSDAPLREVALYAEGRLYRRWTPNVKQWQQRLDGYHAWQHHWHMVVTDSEGRRAISPHLRIVPRRFVFRCGDRQNWLGHVGFQYTGTRLGWLDIHLPVKGTKEGSGTFPYERGACMAPMMEFPLASNTVCVTDFLLTQRYLNVSDFEEIAYDAAPMRVTVPSRIYEGKVGLTNFTPKADGPNIVLCQVDMRLKRDVERAAEGLWPWFRGVSGKYYVKKDGRWEAGDLRANTRLKLRPGDIVGGLVALSEDLAVQGLRFGLVAPQQQKVKAGTSFRARFLILNDAIAGWAHQPKEEFDIAAHSAGLVKDMGFDGTTPYRIKLSRGKLERLEYVASLAASGYGVAGEVKGAPVPYDLPLAIEGLNPRWVAGVWRSDDPENIAERFGFLAGAGLTTMDVSRDVRFYAGNLVRADNADLFLNVEEWTRRSIVVEANNPTDSSITTTIETPPEIAPLLQLKAAVTIPAGATVRIEK